MSDELVLSEAQPTSQQLTVDQECAEAAKSLFEFINFQTAKYGNRIAFTVNIAFVPAAKPEAVTNGE